ncbi:MAG: iron-sulfur cluster assembly accessory protein [Elusimicrobia bacterium]|nr:iron-sulfur cluster assembly accessory protein [Elusimicrobiota bacterium]
MLTITTKAAEKITDFLKTEETAKGKALRLSVAESGCAGYEYRIGFDEKKPADKILPQAGFDVIVDAESLKFIADATIDYDDNEMSSGFRIQNPLEKGSCGCGKSKQF